MDSQDYLNSILDRNYISENLYSRLYLFTERLIDYTNNEPDIAISDDSKSVVIAYDNGVDHLEFEFFEDKNIIEWLYLHRNNNIIDEGNIEESFNSFINYLNIFKCQKEN